MNTLVEKMKTDKLAEKISNIEKRLDKIEKVVFAQSKISKKIPNIKPNYSGPTGGFNYL